MIYMECTFTGIIFCQIHDFVLTVTVYYIKYSLTEKYEVEVYARFNNYTPCPNFLSKRLKF